MNWLDLILLVILAGGGYYGVRTGLVTSGCTAIGIVVGVLLAGQISDDVGERLTDSISNDTLVTFISYAIIIGAITAASRVFGSIVRKIVSMLFLGWADNIGGLVLGMLAGAAISGALITGLARLAYDFEVPGGKITGEVVESVVPIAEAKAWLEDTLVGSYLVPFYINLTDSLPADSLGFVPSDFQTALDILEQAIVEADVGPRS
jgi:uncharacterized membrane protein required for colicin V production